jgi:hypothetical protein
VRHIQYPTYYEWNLELQQSLGTKSSISINYVGNHGSNLAGINPAVNAFCNGPSTSLPFQPGTPDCLNSLRSLSGAAVTGFAGLPIAPTDPRFTTVTEVSNPGVSNYNGLTVSLTRHVSNTFQAQLSYTWSHAMDDVSNGGFLPFNFDTNTSVLSGQDPFNWRHFNYGNADYDVRHQANLNYVYSTPKLRGLFDLLGNWTVSGVLFARTGLPFTAIDGASTGALNAYNYGPGPQPGMFLFADSSSGPISCGRASIASVSGTPRQCPSSANFSSPIVAGVSGLGSQRRNQVYGPSYFDMDLTLMKNFRIPKWEGAEFQVGAQAFNILNHPNFDQPVGDVSNTQFGLINRTVATPTSIYGSFLGASASPRALQIRAQLRF